MNHILREFMTKSVDANKLTNADLLEFNSTTGETIIHRIAEHCDTQALRWLKEHALAKRLNLAAKTRGESNLFHYAPHIKSYPSLQILFTLPEITDLLFAVDDRQLTALELAIDCDNQLFLEFYLKTNYQRTLQFTNHEKRNILHLIIEKDAANCYEKLKSMLPSIDFQLLLTAQPNPLEIAYQLKNRVYEVIQGYQSNGVYSLQWHAQLMLIKTALRDAYPALLELDNDDESGPQVARDAIDDIKASKKDLLVQFNEKIGLPYQERATEDALNRIVSNFEMLAYQYEVADEDEDPFARNKAYSF